MDSTEKRPLPNPSLPPTPLFQAPRAQTRPWPLSWLCIGGALVLAYSVWLAFSGQTARAFGPGYWVYFGATSSALAVALWGLWHLRRWSLWAFPAALLLDNAVLAAMGEFHPVALGLEAALVLLVLGHSRAFRRKSDQPG